MQVLCIICSEYFQNSSDVSATPCGHIFHHLCLAQWMKQSATCPQCRETVTTQNVIQKLYFDLGPDGEEDPEDLSAKNEALKANLQEVKQEVAHLYDVIDNVLVSNHEAEAKLTRLNGDFAEAQQELEHLRTENKKVPEYESLMASLRLEPDKLRKLLAEAQQDVETLTQKMGRENQKVVESKTQIASLDAELAKSKSDLTQKVAEYEEQIACLDNKLTKSNSDLTQARRNIIALGVRLDDLQNENEKLAVYQKEIAALKIELGRYKNSMTHQNANGAADHSRVESNIACTCSRTEAATTSRAGGKRESARIAAKRFKRTSEHVASSSSPQSSRGDQHPGDVERPNSDLRGQSGLRGSLKRGRFANAGQRTKKNKADLWSNTTVEVEEMNSPENFIVIYDDE